MGGGGKAPPAPDYTPVANASQASSEAYRQTAQEQLAWAKEQYAKDREVLDKVLATQLPIMESEAAAGAQLRERYNSVFQPIEDQLVKESQEYASGARSDYDAGRAIASVGQAFDAARSNALARMESFGIDPSQTRASALDAGIRVQEAAAKAAAGTQSRLNTEATGRALRGEAINIGKGLPSNIAGAYNTAQQSGSQSLTGSLATTASGVSSMGNPTQWAGLGNQALGTWGNTLTQAQQGQQQAYATKTQGQGQMGSAIGSLAGMALGAFGGPVGSMVGSALGGMIGGAASGGGMKTGFADGGEVPHDPADPHGKRDTVPAALSGGEFIVPASVVRRLGSEHFDKLVSKFGDDEDRQAAIHRMRTGSPGGEPVRRQAIQMAA